MMRSRIFWFTVRHPPHFRRRVDSANRQNFGKKLHRRDAGFCVKLASKFALLWTLVGAGVFYFACMQCSDACPGIGRYAVKQLAVEPLRFVTVLRVYVICTSAGRCNLVSRHPLTSKTRKPFARLRIKLVSTVGCWCRLYQAALVIPRSSPVSPSHHRTHLHIPARCPLLLEGIPTQYEILSIRPRQPPFQPLADVSACKPLSLEVSLLSGVLVSPHHHPLTLERNDRMETIFETTCELLNDIASELTNELYKPGFTTEVIITLSAKSTPKESD